jgi:hypothetical protein
MAAVLEDLFGTTGDAAFWRLTASTALAATVRLTRAKHGPAANLGHVSTLLNDVSMMNRIADEMQVLLNSTEGKEMLKEQEQSLQRSLIEWVHGLAGEKQKEKTDIFFAGIRMQVMQLINDPVLRDCMYRTQMGVHSTQTSTCHRAVSSWLTRTTVASAPRCPRCSPDW